MVQALTEDQPAKSQFSIRRTVMPRNRRSKAVRIVGILAGLLVSWLLLRLAIDERRDRKLHLDWNFLSETPPGLPLSTVEVWLVEHTRAFDLAFLVLAAVVVGKECGLSFGLKRNKQRVSAEGREAGWDLDAALCRWGPDDAWTVRHAFEGCLIMGATGSGKSSGSGRLIALNMLKAGWGGLVLTAKRGERPVWEEYCEATGRSKDLVIFGSGNWRFNPLSHELQRAGEGAGLTENIVRLLTTILEAGEHQNANGGQRDGEAYWRQAALQLNRNAVDLLSLARGEITVHDLYRVIISAPQSVAEFTSKEWQASSFCFACLKEADARVKSPRQSSDFEMVADYFCKEFPNLSEKTRSIIVSTFTSMIDVLNRGILRDLLCTSTNVTPEDAERGRILLIDLPVKEFGVVGTVAQVIWKYAFQRSLERRDVRTSPRPVFWFADEAQNFVTSYDMQFQATCRSARVASVLLTQNTSNFHAALGGNDKGQAETDSLFGNLNTKILHANSDAKTNEFSAALIGRSRVLLSSGNHSRPDETVFSSLTGLQPLGQSSSGFSETFEYEVQPSTFSRMRTGGPANGGVIDAIVFQSGRLFKATGRPWMKATFHQAR